MVSHSPNGSGQTCLLHPSFKSPSTSKLLVLLRLWPRLKINIHTTNHVTLARMKRYCQYPHRTWRNGLTVRKMVPDNDRDLVLGKRVLVTWNGAAHSASLLCEGKLTQEENKGTSHVPVVDTCAEIQPNPETPQTNEGRRHVSYSPFWGFLGETRRLKMLKGVFWFKNEWKLKSLEISSWGRGVLLTAARFSQTWVHGCWTASTKAHAMLSNSALNNYFNIHFTMLLCVTPIWNFCKGSFPSSSFNLRTQQMFNKCTWKLKSLIPSRPLHRNK